MRRRILIALIAALLLAAVAAPATATSVDQERQEYVYATLIGQAEGLDRVWVGISRPDRAQGPVVNVEFCDYKTSEWPEPPGLEPDCWWTGTHVSPTQGRTVFNQTTVAFDGTVPMLPSYCSWDDPGLCDKPITYVDVSVVFEVGEVEASKRTFAPFPGLTVIEHTRMLTFSDVVGSIENAPVTLEPLGWLETDTSVGLMQHYVVIDKT